MDKRTTTIRSNGEPSARGYACAPVPRRAPRLREDGERVVIVDPHRTATVTGPPPGTGPRDPDQKTLPKPKRPGIETEGRPATKSQHVWIDPDLLARWDEEERQKKAV